MRKIPSDLESPVDDLVLKFTEKSGIMELFYGMGFSPNMITTIGNLFRFLSIYLFLNGNKNLFLLTSFLGFMFDCFDGHYARQYNLTTNFGDYYDHISDLVYHLILGYLIFTAPKFQDLQTNYKLLIILALFLVFFLFLVHMGCQEHYFDCTEDDRNCSHTLSPLKTLCRDKKWINLTKYFGTGTFVLAMYLLAYWVI